MKAKHINSALSLVGLARGLQRSRTESSSAGLSTASQTCATADKNPNDYINTTEDSMLTNVYFTVVLFIVIIRPHRMRMGRNRKL